MHSTIFQIEKYPIAADGLVSEDKIYNGYMVSIDYVSRLNAEQSKPLIHHLFSHVLPAGMFSLNPDCSITFNGGMTKWRKEYVHDIRSKATAINPNNVMEWIGPVYQLQKFLSNPLETEFLFITDAIDNGGTAELSGELMQMVDKMQPGDRLYFGAVFDYHF